MEDFAQLATFLFTDIEGSTRLWEEQPERMREAMARHDALVREAIGAHRGRVVKMTGDGLHAVFDDPRDGVRSAVRLQLGLAKLAAEVSLPLRARCGLHTGACEGRDGDYYGTDVNRAARVMAAAHGGQVLVSEAIATLLAGRLPAGVELVDLGRARLRDLPRPEHLFQVSHEGLRREFPPPRGLEAPPTNLPNPATSFIGRERELAELQALIAERRLVTVTGMGGLGKTRLTLEVAARLRKAFPDGVWFVPLAPLTDPRWVPQAVASALGVKEDAGRPVIEALARHLRDRETLIVLDNCEHVVDACAELAARLLAAGDGTRILASSREALRVAGEAAYPIASLSADGEATRLFIDRATAALPAFRANEANTPAIAAICRRLDGIPLALELAAARVRGLGVQAIAERLDDRFQLLVGGERNVLPRQQTLRALIDWSYDLLTEPERSLFRALSVFAGTWSLEAAEAVGASGDGGAVLELLARLVEKSLVVLRPDDGRYHFLETVREYARERLESSGDAQRMRDRHLDFYVALAEKAKPELLGPDQASWLARLDLERENILAADAWCAQAGRGASVRLRLLGAVKHYWFNRALLELGSRLMTEALAESPERDGARARGLYDVGQLRLLMGEYANARAALEESLSIGRERRDAKAIALVLQPLGMAALCQGDLVTARACIEEALDSARQRGNRREVLAALSVLGQIHRVDMSQDAAEASCEEALALARELDDRESVAIALLNLAMVSLGAGRAERVEAMLSEAAALARELQSRRLAQSVLEVCAGFAADDADAEAAARLYGAAEDRARDTGLRRDPADDAFLAPRVERARNALGTLRFNALVAGAAGASDLDVLGAAASWLDKRRDARARRAVETIRS